MVSDPQQFEVCLLSPYFSICHIYFFSTLHFTLSRNKHQGWCCSHFVPCSGRSLVSSPTKWCTIDTYCLALSHISSPDFFLLFSMFLPSRKAQNAAIEWQAECTALTNRSAQWLVLDLFLVFLVVVFAFLVSFLVFLYVMSRFSPSFPSVFLLSTFTSLAFSSIHYPSHFYH